jgi:hypothetical protein
LFIAIETSFVINVAIKFLLDFTIEGESNPTRSFNAIANRYVKGELKRDIFALIPFQYLELDKHR